ncbi:hypothetical protein [Piscinibacter terrae]|uniref:Uncharacterized protein n=1 Tax=Piscinibacter terrae TaxID=2496871 RepID=A0A3N7HPW1_9BURK|nr:hypothetical protein [Albitalea terrae]RQP24220.1 hypothetical protein DZC73_12950 [Albitalea terrae]
MEGIDYKDTGLSIQQAMLDCAKRSTMRVPRRPLTIQWGNRLVQTSDVWDVQRSGRVYAEILKASPAIEQGFDLSVNGWLRLNDGNEVPTLRTWADDRYENFVEVDFESSDQQLFVWNVYKMQLGESLLESKWGGNAGFWVETLSSNERIYHCSPDIQEAPDFQAFIFRIRMAQVRLT